MYEHTLVLIKPDGVARGLIGAVLQRYERRNLGIAALDMLIPTPRLVLDHYAEHAQNRDLIDRLLLIVAGKPTVALVIAGENAIDAVRTMHGATDPLKAAPGTIRADYATEISQNVVHASDSIASANREIALWFPQRITILNPVTA